MQGTERPCMYLQLNCAARRSPPGQRFECRSTGALRSYGFLSQIIYCRLTVILSVSPSILTATYRKTGMALCFFLVSRGGASKSGVFAFSRGRENGRNGGMAEVRGAPGPRSPPQEEEEEVLN